jgi:hypothetical protein
MTNTTLTLAEKSVLRDQLPHQIPFKAIIIQGDKPKKTVINCKLTHEIGKFSDDFAIRWTFSVSNYVKTEIRKSNDGKSIKGMVELWEPAKVLTFSKQFKLTIENFTESLFPNIDGELVDLPHINNRAQLANYFLALLNHGSIDFINYIEIGGKKIINQAYDTSVLIMLQLHNLTVLHDEKIEISDKDKKDKKIILPTKVEYTELKHDDIIQSFIRASETLKTLNIPLIQGTVLDKFNSIATKMLPSTDPATVKQ